jgi:flagellar motor switch protein FliM
MSRILSDDEIRALLGDEPASEAAPAARVVRALDLARRERSLRGRLPGLELVLDRLVCGFHGALDGFTGRTPEVRVGALELVRFATFAARLPAPVSLQSFRMPPLRGRGLVVVTPALAGAVVQTLFGGAPERATPIVGREFSAIERRVLRRFAARVLEAAAAAWRALVPVECALEAGEAGTLVGSVAAPQDLVVLIELRIDLPGAPDALLALVLPNAMLDPIRRRLQLGAEAEGEAPAGWTERLGAALAEAPLEVTAELGTHRLRLRDLLALRVGDVIPLRTGREGPIVVCVEGRPRFLAAPGVSGGSHALRVLGRL